MKTLVVTLFVSLFLLGCNHAGYYQTRMPPPVIQPYYLQHTPIEYKPIQYQRPAPVNYGPPIYQQHNIYLHQY